MVSSPSPKTQVLTDAETNPHCAVRLLIKSGNTRRLTRQIQRPSLIPGKLPSGPKLEDFYQRHHRQASDNGGSSRMDSLTRSEDVESCAAEWVKVSRKFFSDMLGRDVGDDDQAVFKWRTSQSHTSTKAGALTSEAAAWRAATRFIN